MVMIRMWQGLRRHVVVVEKGLQACGSVVSAASRRINRSANAKARAGPVGLVWWSGRGDRRIVGGTAEQTCAMIYSVLTVTEMPSSSVVGLHRSSERLSARRAAICVLSGMVG